MGLGEIITTLTTSIITVSKNKDVKKMVCGTYTDGRTRSIYDTLNDEYVSPRTKKRISKLVDKVAVDECKKKKKKKSKKKGKKKKNKKCSKYRF